MVAELGDQEIHFADFQGYLESNAGEPEGDLVDKVSSALLDGFLEECLISRWAVDEGLVLASADRHAGVDAVMAELAAPEVSSRAITVYYDEHRDSLSRPERVHLQQLLLGDRVVAEEVRAEWNAGIPFLELVALYSQEGLVLGADEGDLARGELPLIFADAIFDLQLGEVSEVFAADYGFHLFRVTDRLPAGVPALDQVEEVVRRELKRLEVTNGLRMLVVKAGRRYNVRVFERNLPFEYTGEY
ncbi:MAG: hypothetical protein GWO83_00005 [Bacteroidia bacterium]|nr:hypothetical protein [Bacteroidia bacterium]